MGLDDKIKFTIEWLGWDRTVAQTDHVIGPNLTWAIQYAAKRIAKRTKYNGFFVYKTDDIRGENP